MWCWTRARSGVPGLRAHRRVVGPQDRRWARKKKRKSQKISVAGTDIQRLSGVRVQGSHFRTSQWRVSTRPSRIFQTTGAAWCRRQPARQPARRRCQDRRRCSTPVAPRPHPPPVPRPQPGPHAHPAHASANALPGQAIPPTLQVVTGPAQAVQSAATSGTVAKAPCRPRRPRRPRRPCRHQQLQQQRQQQQHQQQQQQQQQQRRAPHPHSRRSSLRRRRRNATVTRPSP